MSPIIETKTELAHQTARILLDTQSVLLRPDEPFTFTSGRKSPVYVDCRRLMSFPKERTILMQAGADLISEHVGIDNIDLLAGGETAGIPYAAFIADKLEKSMIYVRKKPKGFGRMAQIEGAIISQNPKAVLVEDLQTDGGSKEVFIKALRDADIAVSHAFVIFHYGIFQKSIENMAKLDISLLSLATWKDVIEVARQDQLIPEQDIVSIESFLKNPDDWTPHQAQQQSST